MTLPRGPPLGTLNVLNDLRTCCTSNCIRQSTGADVEAQRSYRHQRAGVRLAPNWHPRELHDPDTQRLPNRKDAIVTSTPKSVSRSAGSGGGTKGKRRETHRQSKTSLASASNRPKSRRRKCLSFKFRLSCTGPLQALAVMLHSKSQCVATSRCRPTLERRQGVTDRWRPMPAKKEIFGGEKRATGSVQASRVLAMYVPAVGGLDSPCQAHIIIVQQR